RARSSAIFLGAPCSMSPYVTLPSTVFQGNSANSWNTGPRSGPGPVTTAPFTRTAPLLGVTKPPTIYRSVDLPQPDGPRIETNAPSATSSEMSRSARWLVPRAVSKLFDNRSIEIMLGTLRSSSRARQGRDAGPIFPETPNAVVHGSRLSRHGAPQTRANALEALGRDDSGELPHRVVARPSPRGDGTVTPRHTGVGRSTSDGAKPRENTWEEDMALSRRDVLKSGSALALGTALATRGAFARDITAREKELYELAKKEGEITWYTAHSNDTTAQALGRDFEAAFPGIKAN